MIKGTIRRGRGALVVALTALTTMTAASAAPAKPDVKVTMTQSIVTRDVDGKTVLVPVGAATLESATVIEYQIDVTNTGTAAGLHLRPSAKIPVGTTYKVGSARSSIALAPIEFSIAPPAFSAHPTVVMVTPVGNRRVIASPARYQALRWIDNTAFAPGSKASFTYDVIVK